MRFHLPEVDQKEFGAPEALEWDLWSISVDDLEELAGRFGWDPMDWPDPMVGQLTLEQAGDPEAKPKPPPWRNRAMAWMALRQNGFDVSWERAGKAHVYLWVRQPEPEAPSPGKGSTESPTSVPSAASTTRRSSTSTRSRRSKST